MTKKIFYSHLVVWDDFDQDHHQQIQEILDLVVIDAILDKLHQDHHHDFLILVNDAYEDQSILDWLENKIAGITDHIKQAIFSATQEIKEILSS